MERAGLRPTDVMYTPPVGFLSVYIPQLHSVCVKWVNASTPYVINIRHATALQLPVLSHLCDGRAYLLAVSHRVH